VEDDSNSRDLDTTIIGDGDTVPNYNGVDAIEEDDASEFNFASTMALRKNLAEAFDKHAPSAGENRDNSSERIGTVKQKIQAFEKTNSSSQVRFEDVETTSAPSNLPFIPRPPIVPVSKIETANNSERSILSVFLRVRPPFACKDVSQENSDTLNTVEILKPENSNGNREISSIRTYPPINSNTAKAVRGHHLHSSSPNTDLIFAENSRNSEEGAARGVKEYKFNQVFGADSSQEEIYDGVAIPLIDGLFSKHDSSMIGGNTVGQSALLFSYGITNAGKTYTMMGKDKVKDMVDGACLKRDHGIIPRALHHILTKMKQVQNNVTRDDSKWSRYGLKMSYFEIYNEQIFDLLPTDKKGSQSSKAIGKEKSLRIREGRGGRTYVKGLGKHHVTNFAHGMKLAHAAKSKRHTSCNKINKDSSRSHSICQFELFICQPNQSENDDMSVGSTASGYSTDDDSVKSNGLTNRSVRMWIVDLAGSERSKRTGAFPKSARQKETVLINSSLMKLMRCLQALRNNQSAKPSSISTIVPFRESKLTHLLMDHLNGPAASRTSMVVNINPSASDFDETQHILSYATDARAIRINWADCKRKRNAIQMGGNGSNGHTHGENGRLLKKKSDESELSNFPPKKIARLVKKLSPRAALAKRRDEMTLTKKRKVELQSLRGGATQTTGILERHVKKGKFIGGQNKKRRLEDEVNELKEKLKESRKETTQFQSKYTQLSIKLVGCESEIRTELAEETKVQMNSMRVYYNETINRLQDQILAEPTPSKSVKKVLKDKREEMVEELIDKVDECEDEIERIEKVHEDRIVCIKKEHNEQLNEKEKEISAIKGTYEEEIEKRDIKIGLLKHEMITNQKTSNGRKVERDEIQQRYNDLVEKAKMWEEEDQNSSDGSDLLSFSTEESSPKEEKENSDPSIAHTGISPTPQLRRLPRRKCSEVACADVSPIMEEAPSSKKKRGLRAVLSKNKEGRSPFSLVSSSIHEENKMKRTFISSKEEKRQVPLNDEVDIMYPTSQPEYDSQTGEFQRPRGRAPAGRRWDSQIGGWCFTAMLS